MRKAKRHQEHSERRYRIAPKPSPVDNVVRFSLPVRELGKGYLFAIAEPAIYCDANVCLFAPEVDVLVRTELDKAKIAGVSFTFDVTGMWRARAWWGRRSRM